MGQEITVAQDVSGDGATNDGATREKLLEAARTLVLEGDGKFSISALCAKAGVERAAFRMHFTGKTALMAAVMQNETTPAAQPEAVIAPAAVPPQPAPQPVSKAELEPSVSTPDAWLERRLRVFERALNALDAKADATAREHARAISQLEERLTALGAPQAVKVLTPDTPEKRVEAVAQAEALQPEPAQAEPAKPEPAPLAPELALAPLPVASVSKEEIAEAVQKSRDKARAAAAAAGEAPQPDKGRRIRWLAIAALALVALFLCIGFTLGNTAGEAQAAWQGAATSYRHAAQDTLSRTIAQADYGDARAETRLALAYLRGQGVVHDPAAALRWSSAAAKAGQPVAEYLLGALTQQGAAAAPDPARAFGWFQDAAAKGNLKAMHNLAIAYAEGLGTSKDAAKAAEWFTRAAERGYTDSAFDLAVLYERGQGVPQDLSQALKWYGIAAKAGDTASQARAQFLRGQLRPDDARLAANAAQDFTPLPALESANSL
jgi:AcrR family transcriptional regulator